MFDNELGPDRSIQDFEEKKRARARPSEKKKKNSPVRSQS